MSMSASDVIETKKQTLKTLVISEIKNTKTLVSVRQTAIKLCDQLNNPTRFEYYCKVAWYLPDHKIWNNLEAALKGREPARLFSYLCKKDLS